MRVTTFLAVALCGALLASTATAQQVVNVATVTELQNAVGAAMPGHIITLADGVYNFAGMFSSFSRRWVVAIEGVVAVQLPFRLLFFFFFFLRGGVAVASVDD